MQLHTRERGKNKIEILEEVSLKVGFKYRTAMRVHEGKINSIPSTEYIQNYIIKHVFPYQWYQCDSRTIWLLVLAGRAATLKAFKHLS